MEIPVYDAFTTIPQEGNPAGIILDEGGRLSDETLLAVAKACGYNEIVSISGGQSAEPRFRFFTPGHEIALCGHATVAGCGYLFDRGIFTLGTNFIRTMTGRLKIDITQAVDGKILITMEQGPPKWEPFKGSTLDLCGALGILESELDRRFPIQYGSTGTWTLLVPILEVTTLRKMCPNQDLFPGILKEIPSSSIHPVCFSDYPSASTIHCRHFSSPYSGTTEDPVTGTASGVIGEFLRNHLLVDRLEFRVHQGEDVGRPGVVFVESQKGRPVRVSGTYVKELVRNLETTDQTQE